MAFEWLTQDSRDFLARGYLIDGTTAEQRVEQIANTAEDWLNSSGFSEKFYDYMSKGWYSLSSPIWANFGLGRGLPISCYGSYVDDSMIGILNSAKEIGVMSKYGGGTSAFFGDVRHRGSTIRDNGLSEGSVNFMRLFNTLIDVTKQGGTRRGAFVAYLPMEHKDIDEFLQIKTEGNPIQGIFTGVTVSDDWMEKMIKGDEKKRALWAKVLKSRSQIGIPYIFFTDNVSRGMPESYMRQGMEVLASNLCSEIALPSTEDESFVCDLSSMNASKFEEWEETDAVETLTYFLDAVMSEFIEKSAKIEGLEKANKFASRHRALGIGVLGFHDLLQSKDIPFDDLESYSWNSRVFKHIYDKTAEASENLAKEYGEPEVMVGFGKRNATLTAVAPTTSSAFILGQTSQSIEPYRSNYYVKDLSKKKVTVKNRHLQKTLKEMDKDTDSVWKTILNNGGSVQHLDCLSEHQKHVFRTFSEIPQLAIVQLAASRQKFIDQSQSLNLMIHPNTPLKDINALHIKAWELGVKTLYYQHSVNAAQEFNKDLLMNCVACEA